MISLTESDLYLAIESKIKQLVTSVKSLRKTGTDAAEAERDYKILLAKECLRLRDEGQAIGMINLTVYGQKNVAEARFKRDVAQTIYEANQEAINALKLEIRILDSQLSREWSVTNENNSN